jgi:hypothetical protein
MLPCAVCTECCGLAAAMDNCNNYLKKAHSTAAIAQVLAVSDRTVGVSVVDSASRR